MAWAPWRRGLCGTPVRKPWPAWAQGGPVTVGVGVKVNSGGQREVGRVNGDAAVGAVVLPWDTCKHCCLGHLQRWVASSSTRIFKSSPGDSLCCQVEKHRFTRFKYMASGWDLEFGPQCCQSPSAPAPNLRTELLLQPIPRVSRIQGPWFLHPLRPG